MVCIVSQAAAPTPWFGHSMSAEPTLAIQANHSPVAFFCLQLLTSPPTGGRTQTIGGCLPLSCPAAPFVH
jgi:hypothetical protein